MSEDISGYVDPGIYQSEVINPSSLAVSSVPALVAVVGIAPRSKYSFNESVRRGQVNLEAVTLASSSPHTYTLLQHGNRRQQDTQLVRNGQDLMPGVSYSYLAAKLQGVAAGAGFLIPASCYLTISLDQRPFISIPITAGATRTAVQVAADINTGLVASTLYGAAYANAATAPTGVAGVVQILSPLTAPALSDLRIISTPTSAHLTAFVGDATDASSVVFPAAGLPYQAPTILQLADSYYTGTDTFTVSYIATNTLQDPLINTGIIALVSIGLFAGVTSFTTIVDYLLTGNAVDWTPNGEAVVVAPSAVVGGPIITAGTNDGFRLAINGLPDLLVTLPNNGAGQVPWAEITSAINNALVNSPNYGPLYGNVASSPGNILTLTAPSPYTDIPLAQGVNSSIEFFATPANSITLLMGIALTAMPYMQVGVSNQPAPGAAYFATYTFVRPTTDYNNASNVDHLFFNPQDALAYTGPLTQSNASSNQLGIATGIAFDNGAPTLCLIQVNDSTTPGFPSINQIKAAIDAAGSNENITDIVVLDSRVAVQAYLVNHCTVQSSITQKNYRNGWFGMGRNTPIGDNDTANSYVYAAQTTLQVAPDSPGRGRFRISAPPNVSRTVTFADGTEKKILLDGNYLSLGCASRNASFSSVATSLLRKTVVGFDVDDFQVYAKGERKALASKGVNVVTIQGGRLVLTDPVSTEQGAGNLREFTEINAMGQKDSVVRFVDQVLNTNVIGITPSDLTDFIGDVKSFIGIAIRSKIEAGDCARYKDSAGNVRDINLSTDVQVFQSPTDPTKFNFRYFFNLRYTAKRFYGEFSCDNPFFAVNSTQTSLEGVFRCQLAV